MPTITTKDGTEIFYKDWGQRQPIVFDHGWPLSSDDWDAQFFIDSTLPFYGYNRDGAEDLKRIEVPTPVMHGEDDQIVPFADAGALSAKLAKGAVLKSYPGFPHGMPTTHAEQINADLLAFIKS